MNKRKVKLIIAAVFAILLVYKICYWVTLHPTGTTNGSTYLDRSDGFDYSNLVVDEATGLCEGGGQNWYQHCVRDCKVTIKGEIKSGFFRYSVYDDNGRKGLEIELQPGTYDEEYVIEYLGYSCDEEALFPPETEGILDIDFYPQATGFDLDGFKKQPPME